MRGKGVCVEDSAFLTPPVEHCMKRTLLTTSPDPDLCILNVYMTMMVEGSNMVCVVPSLGIFIMEMVSTIFILHANHDLYL